MQISHPDLSEGIIGGGFFLPSNGSPATPDFFPLKPGMMFPDEDHGTFCLGMSGARMNNEQAGCGSAPEADLIAIACANDQTGTQTTLARSIDFAINPKSFHKEADPEGGTDIIACSLATNGIAKDVLKLAVDSATESGRNKLGAPIFWAVANDDELITDDDVCSLPNVIAVGRSDRNGQVECSAFGPSLSFVAPGVEVFSTRSDSLFDIDGGTSFATPLAAGVAALVLSIRKDLTSDQVADLLRDSCLPQGKGPDDKTGFGILNAAIAVEKAKLL